MKKVQVNTTELLTVLIENRDKHQAEYKDAYKGYVKAAITQLEKNLESFKSGKSTDLKWSEAPPKNNTKDYDRVIKMLQMSVDETIELTSDEFANFVQDDWSWKQNWTLSNSKYMSIVG